MKTADCLKQCILRRIIARKIDCKLCVTLATIVYAHNATKLLLVGNYRANRLIKRAFERSSELSVEIRSSKDLVNGVGTDASYDKTDILLCAPLDSDLPSDYEGIAISLQRIVSLDSSDVSNIKGSLVLNTLENSFSEIIICGRSVFARQIAMYLSSNPIVHVTRQSTLPFYDYKFSCRRISIENLANTLVIVADAVVPCPIKLINADQVVNSVNLLSILGQALPEGCEDICQNIIPRMLRDGISVAMMAPVNKGHLNFSKIESMMVSSSMRFFSMRRKLVQGSHLKREFAHLGELDLYEEAKSRRVDNRWGYPLSYVNSNSFNCPDGFRSTPDNNSNANKRVFFFGPCLLAGGYARDTDTIPAVVKRRLDDCWAVINKATFTPRGMNCIIRDTEFHPGDAVIIMTNMPESELSKLEVPIFDSSRSYNKIRNLSAHVCDTLYHCDAFVLNQVATDLIAFLDIREFFDGNPLSDAGQTIVYGNRRKMAPSIESLRDTDLSTWLVSTKELLSDTSGMRGAIVMNCNPFTKGHRYLIEKAASEVDTLIVFVVEEDKSVFPFKDRLRLVEEGCSDLSNVVVAKSGRHIISSQTLPGYFDKDSLGSILLDASNDLQLFATIADELSIRVRFAGEEPMDAFTHQYNEEMASKLPRYGIEFREVKRTTTGDGAIISASQVRKAIAERDVDTVKSMVPENTFMYLVNRFGFNSPSELE